MACDMKTIRAIGGVKEITNARITTVVDEDGNAREMRIHAVLGKSFKGECPVCGAKCPGYDHGRKELHAWRALDCNGCLVYIECELERVCCKEHGVHFERVPWAYPGSSFTKMFDHFIACLVGCLPKSNISAICRIDWKTVGRCITRSRKDLEPNVKERLNGLRHIGIDETSYKKGHKYITHVVDHDRGRVVWVHKGHEKEVLKLFFEELSEEQRANIEVVTGDGAPWIWSCVREYLPNAACCIDTFHLAQWGVLAMDQIRREIIRAFRSKIEDCGSLIDNAKTDEERDNLLRDMNLDKAVLRELKRSKYALGKGQENLTENQSAILARILAESPELARAHSFKERLRAVTKNKDPNAARRDLDRWINSAIHSNLKPIKKLANTVKKFREMIINTITYGFNNARIEATNTKIKLLIRQARGFRKLANLIDLIFLKCSDLRPPLPHKRANVPKAA